MDSAQDVLEALQSKPDDVTLGQCLNKLLTAPDRSSDIRVPGPLTAQIIDVLLNDIVPSYWPVLGEHDGQRDALLQCLTSVAGVRAVTARLSKDGLMLDVLENVLRKDSAIYQIWKGTLLCQGANQTALWKDSVALTGSGKLLSSAAEAFKTLQDAASDIKAVPWIADGRRYSAWLGRNIRYLLLKQVDNRDVAQLLSKALRLGALDELVDSVFSPLLRGDAQALNDDRELLCRLDLHDQKVGLHAVLRLVSGKTVDGAAGLISGLTEGSGHLRQCLGDWLANGIGVGLGAGIHRSVVAAIISRLGKSGHRPH
jgi:telomere length regulation protein